MFLNKIQKLYRNQRRFYEKNKEKYTDKILGMNRVMFFIIVILLCILSLSIGIYAQVFYRYSDTDPFMLGIGVGRTQDAAEITELKNNFNKVCMK